MTDVIRISRRKRTSQKGLCANLNCLAPMEPPIPRYDFLLDDDPHTYRRHFCVQCREMLDTEDCVTFELETNNGHC